MHSVSEFQNRVEPKLDTKQYILCDAIYVKLNRQNESAVTGAEQSFLAGQGGLSPGAGDLADCGRLKAALSHYDLSHTKCFRNFPKSPS